MMQYVLLSDVTYMSDVVSITDWCNMEILGDKQVFLVPVQQ